MDKSKVELERENAEYLSKMLTEIDGIFSGRKTLFLSYTHNGLHYSKKKAKIFISKLIEVFELKLNEQDTIPSPNWKEFYSAFYEFVILFCELQCNREDWCFDSFIKLAKAIKKDEYGISVADVLYQSVIAESANSDEVKTQLALISQVYATMTNLYDKNYTPDFVDNVTLTINTFLHDENLNLFCNEETFNYAMSILNSSIRRISRIANDGGQNE